MPKYKLNLIDALQREENIENPEIERKISPQKTKSKKTIRITIIIVIIVSFLFFSRGIITEISLIQEIPKLSFWTGVAKTLIFQETLMKGEIYDRINILILGMSGTDYDGAYLTDTMVLASLKPSTKEIALLSFPRDLWAPIPEYGWAKINYANAYGELNNNRGSELATQVIGQITSLPIHYFVRIDFNGFKEIIDALDGIEINVEKSFVDAQYPGLNFTFRTVSFQKGLQKMNGARALEYTRSRHGTNGEGSDFARSKRQQKVIFAIKEKLEDIKIFENPQKAWIVFNLMTKYFETNLDFKELITLSQKIEGITQEKIINRTLDLSENSPLYSDMYNDAYILRTKSGNFDQISQIAKNIFTKEKPSELLSIKEAKVVILNGTYMDGLARAKADLLIGKFELIEVGNAERRDYQQTTIYDLSKGTKNSELNNLKKIINGLVISENVPPELALYGADFIIVLGENN